MDRLDHFDLAATDQVATCSSPNCRICLFDLFQLVLLGYAAWLEDLALSGVRRDGIRRAGRNHLQH